MLPAYGYNFNDGDYHRIDYAISDTDGISVDLFTPGVETEVEITNGAQAKMCNAYEDSQVTMNGGNLTYDLWAYDRSQMTLSGGTLRGLYGHDNSQITVTGGSLAWGVVGNINSRIDIFDCQAMGVTAIDNSHINIMGGVFAGNIQVWDDAKLTLSGGTFGNYIISGGWHDESSSGLISLDGSDFKINGISVDYGDFASQYASWGTHPDGSTPSLTGIITGTLKNGQSINKRFYLSHDADITFIPEPATLLLLSLGGLLLRRKGK